MHQVPHDLTDGRQWPTPMGNGVFIEIDFTKKEAEGLVLLDGGLRNLQTAVVRSLSPFLPEPIKEVLLPEGPGSFGARILFSEASGRYLQDDEYKASGFELPEPETNGKGDLYFIHYPDILALVPSDHTTVDMSNTTLPFAPLGARVFIAFDYDDESINDVTLESGLIVRERDLATENQLATVTAVGPNAEYVTVGSRVIAPRAARSISYAGEKYYFVPDENSLFALIPEAA